MFAAHHHRARGVSPPCILQRPHRPAPPATPAGRRWCARATTRRPQHRFDRRQLSHLDAFFFGLHRELRGSGVQVSVIKPGPVQSGFYASAARRPRGRPVPAERFAVRPELVADCIRSLLRRPRRMAYIPPALWLVPWLELSFGCLIDRLGPLLLR